MEKMWMFQFLGSLFASGSLVYMTESIKKGIKTHLKLQRRENIAVEIESLPAIIKDFKNMNISYSMMILRRGIYKHTEDFKSLLNDIPHIDSTSLYNALPTIRFLVDYRGRFPKGEYIIDENTVAVNPHNERSTCFYSLMKAMASRRLDDLYAQGFARYKNDDECHNIGRGLTDAYFDILFYRYFSPLVKEVDFTTPIELSIMAIESLVGQKNLETMFFSCSLDGLIDALAEYSSRETAISLIRKIDHIYETTNIKNLITKNLSRTTYHEIIEILTSMLITKSTTKSEPLDEETLERLLEAKFSSLSVSYSTPKKEKEKILKMTEQAQNRSKN